MSAGTVLHAAVCAHLASLGRVFGAPPARAALPYRVVEDPVLAAGDGAGVAGRTGSVAIGCVAADAAEARAQMAALEARMATLPPECGAGWRLTAVRPVRSQTTAKGERWTATLVFAVRLYRIN